MAESQRYAIYKIVSIVFTEIQCFSRPNLPTQWPHRKTHDIILFPNFLVAEGKKIWTGKGVGYTWEDALKWKELWLSWYINIFLISI